MEYARKVMEEDPEIDEELLQQYKADEDVYYETIYEAQ